MTTILIAALVLGGLGLIFGLLLTLANKVFEVPSDPRRDAVRNCLPGANCGGCGYAGCDALADAIAQGKAPVNACPVGGAAVAKQVAEIMGVEDTPVETRNVATVVCQGSLDRCKTKFPYHGIQDCVAATLVNDGNRACKYACLGLGTCVRACKFDAITIQNHLPVIDREKCTSCMICAETCPTGAIWGDFDNRKIAAIDRDLCIGCTICKRTCRFEAISGELKQVHEVNEACTGCGECVKKCPKKAITLSVRKHVRDANAKVGTTMVEPAVPKE